MRLYLGKDRTHTTGTITATPTTVQDLGKNSKCTSILILQPLKSNLPWSYKVKMKPKGNVYIYVAASMRVGTSTDGNFLVWQFLMWVWASKWTF